jgi:hypothetical protein
MINVDPQKGVSLDFGYVNAVISPWERASVRITPNEYFDRYTELLCERNFILFDNESYLEDNSSLSKRAGFVVKVPESAAIEIVAGRCVIRNCMVIAVKSQKAELNDCKLLENFRFVGEYARVENSVIGDNSSFRAQTLAMRYCNCSTLILNTNSINAEMSVELRNIRGEGVSLGTEQVRQIHARLHHVRLNRLVVADSIKRGIIKLESSRIDHIKNNSSIPIMKSVLGHRRILA